MSSNLDKAFHDVVLRSHPTLFLRRSLMTLNPGRPFLNNWHIQAILYQLDRIRRGEITRLIINMPPRSLKSLTVSVAYPAYLLGLEPHRKIFSISYSNELSFKHSSDFRSIVTTPWYRRAFPKMQIVRSVEDEISTSMKGFRKAASVYGTLTGLGGDLLILDDPQKPIDAQSALQRDNLNQWFANTLLSRLDNKQTGAIILVTQRVHLNDLTGYLTEGSNDWTVLNLAAIAEQDETVATGIGCSHLRRAGDALHPEHETPQTLLKLQQTLGSEVFAAQYQQCPVPPGGGYIKRKWVRYYEKLPPFSYRAKIIQSWDTAAKGGAQNDWSVCTTWLVVDDNYYLIDLVRGRFEYPRLREAAIAQAKKHKPRVILIEDASVGSALAQELKTMHLGGAVRLIPVHGDKMGRLWTHQAKFEMGLVHFPKGAAFLPDLETELFSFPQGKHDDQVDSLSQALDYRGSTYTLDNVR
jgi:predicted phage terminase large subunit-like protein